MNILIIVLRLVHILAGMFWVGGSVFLVFFISPTVAATAEAGQKFMISLVKRTQITLRITAAAILTVLAGGWLYWIDSAGLSSGWTNSGPGAGFGLGGFFALIGLIFGILVGTNINSLVGAASQVQGKPTDEQLKTMQTAQRRLAVISPISSIVLILALICMATARYWQF